MKESIPKLEYFGHVLYTGLQVYQCKCRLSNSRVLIGQVHWPVSEMDNSS